MLAGKQRAKSREPISQLQTQNFIATALPVFSLSEYVRVWSENVQDLCKETL